MPIFLPHPPRIGHFAQKTSFFPLLLFILHGKNNFTAVKLPVLIHIIIIHQKMEKKLGITMLIFLPHPPQIGHFAQKTSFFPLLLFISHGKNNFTAVNLPVLIHIIIIHQKMGKKLGITMPIFLPHPPRIGHFAQKTSFFPLLLFILHGKNNFTAVKLPVLIHIIIIHQKMEKKLGITMLIFLPHPPQIGHFAQKTSFFPLLLFISHGKNNFTAVKLPVLIHIIIIHQKMEKKLGITMLIFLPHPPQIGHFAQKTSFF